MYSELTFEEHGPISTGSERVESSIERVLRSGGTRSELRELIDRFADLARIAGVPASEAIGRLEAVAARVASGMPTSSSSTAVGDSLSDRRAMMARWCSARYQRAD